MEYSLLIDNKGSVQDATDLCEGEIRLTSVRRGSPARLECRIVRDGVINFVEGNRVMLTVDNVSMFSGIVARKQRNSDQIISVSAYDQIWYLKNRETIVYIKKKASEVLQMLADDYGLQLGNIADTGYEIPNRSEDMQTLMDIVYNALDLTLINTGKLFVLYDDFGFLTLKNIEDMRLDLTVSSEGDMINFDYRTDIDTDTYNKIKLVRDDKNGEKREAYIAMDSGNIKNWGLLQLHEKVDEDMTEGQIIQRANQLLKNHNRLHRALTIEKLIGVPSVRAGNSLFVEIPDLGEISLNQLLVIEKCVHTISNNQHSMQLEMYGW